MAKVNIRKAIEDFFRRLRFASRMLVVSTDKNLMGKCYEEPKPEVAIVHQTTEVEPDIVVYSKEEIELKYVAIDKLFEMQSRFSKQEYLWIKQMVTDARFLKVYFESTNTALVEYLDQLNKEGRFSYNILSAMEGLGMVVLSLEDRAKFINLQEYFGTFNLEFKPFFHDEIEHKFETSNKKNS